MPVATVNGQQIAYDDTGGDLPAVILAHGFLMDRSMFVHQVAALRDRYRVITWDERGFGDTVFDGAPFTYWDSARDCLALLDHLGIERAVVGGMSQGGFLSLRVALLAPARVRALVLLDTQAGAEDADKVAAYSVMIDTWVGVGPVDELAQIVAGIIIDDPTENPVWIAKWQSRPKELMVQPGACLLGREDISDRLAEITVPALVVHGTNDTAISMEHAEALSAGLAGSSGVVKVPGAHAANHTHPDAVNAALVAFLDGLPG
jgi:pimeloyl-ACP methyl ester carboxylesterase